MADSAPAEQADAPTKLEYVAFDSQIDMPFYTSFFASKLEHDKLNDDARMIGGVYEPRGEKDPNMSVKMQIHSTALTNNKYRLPKGRGAFGRGANWGTSIALGACRAEGVIKNLNTIEDYKKFDKAAMMQRSGKQIWDAINDGSIFEIPALLASFFIVSYADLKKYRFMYHFAFPALYSEPHWNRSSTIDKFGSDETRALVEAVGTWRYSTDKRQHGFFLARRVPLSAREADIANDSLGFKWEVRCLQAYEDGFFKDIPEKDRFIAFVDSSTFPTAPSWPIRNLLILVRHRWKLNNAQILCYRDTQATRDEPKSIILNLTLGLKDDELALKEMPKVVGWEKNQSGKLGPRVTDLAEYIDPTRLADQAVDLNLKLMKWRIAPSLDLDTIKNTKCLLLGAGTLGSYVSRNLMGWGIRKITFVDYGAVSFSNPVRQPLFVYEDCLKGGAPKAIRAAEAVTQINPSVESTGHVISVPMLGHPILDEKKTQADYDKLEQLIDEHDAIFLLMDSRESRWLPTVMGKAKGKIVMNAALGFDTYVVMRHGPKPNDDKVSSLGCYFCNDVVTPGNSQKDQTLDQQCTVTRPGVAAIASALLVELLTSVLQHPLKHHAPAPPPKSTETDSHARDPEDHPLGVVPHQIRGFLANFQNLLISGPSYPHCSACSEPVLQAWEKDKWAFVKKCLNEKDYVSEISGLDEVQRLAEKMAEELGFSEDEEGEGDEEGVLI